MAYQVAQAYDENKNLVPLYVLTDGEIWNNYPETADAFTFAFVSESMDATNAKQSQEYTYMISSSAINPIGSQKINTPYTSQTPDFVIFKNNRIESVIYTSKINIINDCPVGVRFSYNTSIVSNFPLEFIAPYPQNDIEISAGSTVEITFKLSNTDTGSYVSILTMANFDYVTITRLYS